MDTSVAEARAATARRMVAAERRLQQRIAHLHEKLMEARTDFRLAPENVLRAVTVALELAEKSPLKPVSLPGVPDGKVFEVPVLPSSWGRATAGLEHPHTHARRPITFDHDVARGRDDVVLVHLNHSLVQMSLRLLREEVWKLGDIKRLHRVAVRALPDDDLAHPVVAIWSRLVITGGGHHRLHEELTLAGGELKHDDFTRIGQIGRLEALIDNATSAEPQGVVFGMLKERLERHEEAVRMSVEARSRERLRYLQVTLARRKHSEIEDLMAVLDDLEKCIERELADAEPRFVQSALWPDDERNQLRRDLEALRARLLRIPDERKSEAAAIEGHYSNPEARTFPVAVVFLVPSSSARSIGEELAGLR